MLDRLKAIARGIGPYLLLALLCAAFFWRIWTPNPADRESFAGGDFSGQFYAFARYQADRMWSGQLPLWNPYVSSGQPFLADIQSAAYYPPRWISIGLSGPGGFSYFVLELEAIAHIFLAGAFTYAFARRLFADRAAAFISAIAFAFGGYLTSYPILQLAILETITWLPLILLLVDRAFTQEEVRSRNIATVSAGLVWAVVLLGGHPQTAMQVAYAALIYGIWRAYTRRERWTHALGRLAVFVIIGLSASAAQWLPSFEFMQHSTRAEYGYDALSGGFPVRDVVQVLLPSTTSLWSPLYVGVLPLFLATLSGRGERRRETFFWWSVAAGAFVLSLGGNTFLYNLFYQWIPGFDLFRSQERAAGIVSFSLAIAAGGGFAALRAPEAMPLLTRLRRVLSWTALGLLLLVSILYVLWQAGGGSDVAYTLDRSAFTLLIIVASIGWLLLRPALRDSRLWVMLLIGLVVFDLFSVNWQTVLEKRLPESHTQFPNLLALVRSDADLARVDGRAEIEGNWGNLAGLQTVNGISPLVIEQHAHLREALPKEREWELLNVRYVVTRDGSLAVPAEVVATENWQGRSLNLFRLNNTVPRAWIVHRVRVLDDSAALDVLNDAGFDRLAEALVREPAPVSGTSPTSSARIVDYQPEHIAIDVDASSNGLLVLSEVVYPGWRASVDGVETPILQADVALRAVSVPAGRHRVEMVFQPASVTIGQIASGVAWVVACVALAWMKRAG